MDELTIEGRSSGGTHAYLLQGTVLTWVARSLAFGRYSIAAKSATMTNTRWACALALCLVAGLDSCGGKSSPPADFQINVSSSTLTTVEGGTTYVDEVDIGGVNNFVGSPSVWLAGLPPGTTSNLDTPTLVVAVACYNSCGPMEYADQALLDDFPLTITTTDATPIGTFTLTLHATSGALSHDKTLTLVVGPVVQTSQQGTVLYLQSHANGHTARIGLDTALGGAIVEVSMDGTNFVNRHDTGREVQPALYDGAASYPDLGLGSAYGWDPVLAGDAYGRGSAVPAYTVSPGSLYTQSVPLQWWPDNFGGGASAPIAADMTFEQTVTVDPSAPLAFKVHYKLIHNGSDTHYNSGQEFPAVYVNSTYTTFAYYGAESPWTQGPITMTPTVQVPASPFPRASYAPELWGALVDGGGQGLAVYVPGQYPYENAWGFANQSGSGPLGDATVYMSPAVYFTVAPGAVIEGDVYLAPGDLYAARDEIYAVHESLAQSLAPADLSAPLTNIERPVANATIGGAATVSGWAFDNVAMADVSVFVDGVDVGSATTGGARPDVASAYLHVAPPDSGWSYALDTTKLTNGAHSLTIHATDTAGNTAINAPVTVTVSN